MRPPLCAAARRVWRSGGAADAGTRLVPEETAIAFSYENASYAVMMATPSDLVDFAVGFSLNEGAIDHPREIEELAIVPAGADGIVLRMLLAPGPAARLWQRRRRMAGPSGCGLCGIESLAEAMRALPPVTADLRLGPDQIAAAIAALGESQPLHAETRAVHAAGFWTPDLGLIAVREDIGRHNALDKLAGALARGRAAGTSELGAGATGGAGAVLLTSRVSVELVQKTQRIGAAFLIAVSAPTALAIRTAEAAGITLIAVARKDGFEVFTHGWRVE